MIAHIDNSLEALKEEQRKKGTMEKYNALELWFKEGLTYEQIGEKMRVSKNTSGRWIEQMIKLLGIKLFGVDSLRMDLLKVR